MFNYNQIMSFECSPGDLLKIINGVLSLMFVISNGIYVIWGLIIRNKAPDMKRERLGEYVNMLDHYVNVVSFVDIILVPAQIIAFVVWRYCCHCRMGDGEHSRASSSDNGFSITKTHNLKRKDSLKTFQTA